MNFNLHEHCEPPLNIKFLGAAVHEEIRGETWGLGSFTIGWDWGLGLFYYWYTVYSTVIGWLHVQRFPWAITHINEEAKTSGWHLQETDFYFKFIYFSCICLYINW